MEKLHLSDLASGGKIFSNGGTDEFFQHFVMEYFASVKKKPIDCENFPIASH